MRLPRMTPTIQKFLEQEFSVMKSYAQTDMLMLNATIQRQTELTTLTGNVPRVP